MLSARRRSIRKLGLVLLGIGIVGLLVLTVRATSPGTFGPIFVPAQPEPGQTLSPPSGIPTADAAEAGGLAPNPGLGGAGASGGEDAERRASTSRHRAG